MLECRLPACCELRTTKLEMPGPGECSSGASVTGTRSLEQEVIAVDKSTCLRGKLSSNKNRSSLGPSSKVCNSLPCESTFPSHPPGTRKDQHRPPLSSKISCRLSNNASHFLNPKSCREDCSVAEKTMCEQPEPATKACCSSSETLQNVFTSPSYPETCGADISTFDSEDCHVSASSQKVCCQSNLSSESTLAQSTQGSMKSDDRRFFNDHEGLTSTTIDLEKGFAMVHVVIHVSGMTCTGCERKLQRVLSGISGVHNVKTSLVLNRAEFDVATGISINQVILLLEKQTDYKCIIDQEGHQLEVLLPERPSHEKTSDFVKKSAKSNISFTGSMLGSKCPFGVQSIEILDCSGQVLETTSTERFGHLLLRLGLFTPGVRRKTARIAYDPCVVGARDLLEKGFDHPLSLAPLGSDHTSTAETNLLRETLYMTSISAILTIPVLILSWAPLPPQHYIAYSSSSLVLATLVQFIVAGPFYPTALKTLVFSRMIEMDMLIVISTTTAYVYSIVAYGYEVTGRPLSTGGFFQTSTLLITLIMCGRLASAYARRKATESISIRALQPSTAVLVEESNERLIDVRAFQYGDLFKVFPDTMIPTDGIIVSGETEINESMITGEAVPVPKHHGSRIVAGSLNMSGQFTARLTKLPIENAISRVINMVKEAKLSKPKVQDTADRIASYFVPCILALAVTVFLIWVAVGITFRASSNSDAVVTAITYSLASLIISCPCAIGLAVPMVMVIASGVGAKHGVIFKWLGAVEIGKRASHVVFDKTGTLTKGDFTVVEEIYRGEHRNKAKMITKLLTSNSEHPISQALARHFGCLDTGAMTLNNFTSVMGKGMRATFDGQEVTGGNPLFVGVSQDLDVQHLLSGGLTVFCLRHGSTLLAIYGLRDTLRTDTASCISALQARNIPVSIVSGDSCIAVDRLAMKLGIPLTHSLGQCSPKGKANYVRSLSSAQPERHGKCPKSIIVFCGDGTNDALALAEADIGVHMAGGTDVAKSAADVILTHSSIRGVLILMDLSRAAMHRVHLNFAWSFIYNLFAILLAAGAFVEVRIPPAYAGIGELVSVLPVVAVAMQLRWTRLQ